MVGKYPLDVLANATYDLDSYLVGTVMECLFLGNDKIRKSTEGLYNLSFSRQKYTTLVKGVTMRNDTSYLNMPYSMSVAATEKVKIKFG